MRAHLALILLESMSCVPAAYRQVSHAEFPNIHNQWSWLFQTSITTWKSKVFWSHQTPASPALPHMLPGLGYLANMLQPPSDSQLSEALRKPDARRQGGYLPSVQHSAWSSGRALSSPSALTCKWSPSFLFHLIRQREEMCQ